VILQVVLPLAHPLTPQLVTVELLLEEKLNVTGWFLVNAAQQLPVLSPEEKLQLRPAPNEAGLLIVPVPEPVIFKVNVAQGLFCHWAWRLE